MRARYYNPQIKRFINRDIIDGSITDSQSLNKYSYVQGNPISLVVVTFSIGSLTEPTASLPVFMMRMEIP